MNDLNIEQIHTKQHIEAMQPGDRLIVSGRAGSGKTYAIANSVAQRKALFLTPTHPARTVLEMELTEKRHCVTTIHSAIGWRQYRDENLEMRDRYVPAHQASRRTKQVGSKDACLFSEVDIVIVDEFSMVGSFLFQAVEEYAKEFDLPVVYSGDRFQLPPVEDREVIMDQNFQTITLNRSMRFPESSEIYRLGEMLRYMIAHDPDGEIPMLYSGPEVQVMQGDNWMGNLTACCADNASCLAVTSDNKTLKRLRGKVRQVDHDRLAVGDLVISKKTDEKFNNGEQFTICQIEPDQLVLDDVPVCVSGNGKLIIPGYTVNFAETGTTAFVVEEQREVKKHSQNVRNDHADGLLDHAEASRILDCLDQINEFELSSLSTVHKSQGRSVDMVFIDTATVLKRPFWLSPENHKRLLYTAITRARREVAFYAMKGYCEQARGAEVIPLFPESKSIQNVRTQSSNQPFAA